VIEVDLADLQKEFMQASDMPIGHPELGHVDSEMFRRGPITAGPTPPAMRPTGVCSLGGSQPGWLAVPLPCCCPDR